MMYHILARKVFPGLRKVCILMAACLSPVLSPVLAQTDQTEPISIQHADRFESSHDEGTIVTTFLGNVHIEHQGASITCEKATYYEDEGKAILEEKVTVVKAARTIRAGRMEYDERQHRVVGRGEARIMDMDARLTGTAGYIQYDLDTESGFLTADPFLLRETEDGSTEATLSGDTIFVWSLEKLAIARGDSVRLWYEQEKMEVIGTSISYEYGHRYGLAAGRPLIRKHGEAGDSLFSVLCDTTEVFLPEDRFVARGAVQMERESFVAEGAQAFFDNEKRLVTLTGQPVLRHRTHQLTGDTLELYLHEWTITDVVSIGNARILSTSRQDSLDAPAPVDELSGKRMRLYLADEEAESLVVTGNATSLYHLKEGEQKGEKNEASGDTIVLYFSGGEMARTVISGGARGLYTMPADQEGEASDSVGYESAKIDYHIQDKMIFWRGKGRITYQDLVLTAGRITYGLETDILTAEGYPDSSGSLIETPVLLDGAQEMAGTWLEYNLKTKRGKSSQGRTRVEKGFYTGQSVRQVGDKVLNIDHGNYTTCDLTNPHYHFYTRRMKVYQNDKVIARPVVLYIRDIPVAILPFAIFPIKKGRHSGLLIPRYGSTDADGRSLRDAGYYFAPSGYWDALCKVSLFEKTGWMLESKMQYALRYHFSGAIGGSYRWDRRTSATGETTSKRWSVMFNHTHILDPTLTLKASGDFVSDTDYFQDVSENPRERMERILRSEFALDKRWAGSSLNLRFYNERNLDEDRTTQNLPTLTFRKSQSPVFGAPADTGEAGENRPHWYHSLSYTYNGQAVNWRKEESRTSEQHFGVDHRLNLSASQTISGWLGLTPRLDLRETWYDEDKNGNHWVRRGSYEAAVSSNATLYGMFHPGIGPLTMLRHKMQPRLQFSYRPDISDRDRYYSFGGISSVGGPQSALSIGLSNYFQGKTVGTEGEKKFDIASLDFSTGYNFKAVGQKVSALSSVLRVFPSRIINVDLNASHSFYDRESGAFKIWLPCLQNMGVTTTLRLQAGSGKGLEGQDRSGEYGYMPESIPESDGLQTGRGVASEGGGKWDMALSHYYALSRVSSRQETQWLSLRVGLPVHRDWCTLTRNWMLSYASKYDLEERRFISQQVVIHKDLHCWEAQLVWIPTGGREGYYFRINVKMLPELKLERSRGISGAGF